jgi:hypothetical protein
MRCEVRWMQADMYIPWDQGGDGSIPKPRPRSQDFGSDELAALKHAAAMREEDYVWKRWRYIQVVRIGDGGTERYVDGQ